MIKTEKTPEEDIFLAFKPGQKYPTPSPGNGDRVFYETLLTQRPDSEMAQDWCLAYGILDEKKAKQLLEQVNSRKQRESKGKSGVSPVKSSSNTNHKGNSKSSIPPTKKGKKVSTKDDFDIEADTGNNLILYTCVQHSLLFFL